jgi:signal transduction histidine kinase
MDSSISNVTSAPNPGWRERLRYPESDLGALESAYRQSTIRVDASQLRIIAYIYIAALLVYIVNDYQLFGLTPPFLLLTLVRGVLVTSVVVMLRSLVGLRSFDVMDRVVFVAAMVAMCMHLYIIYSRPVSLTYIDLLIVFVVYLGIPNRFYFRLIPALLFSVGDILLFAMLRPDPGSVGLFALGTALVIGNFIGLVTSARLYISRRSQFKAQHEERQAHREVEQLAILLREANEVLDQKVRERTAELAQANAALTQANRQLQELDHLKSGFLGVITHELRSPFVNITMSLQLIERYGLVHLLPEQREQLQQLNSGVQSAKVMIDNLVKFATFLSKQGEVHPAPVKLGILVENALLPLTFQAQRKGLTLKVNIPDDLPAVRVDEALLGEAVYHLTHNAIKFTSSGGEVSLRAWEEGDLLHLEVKDNGIGVPADKLPTLWDSFSQMADPLQRGVEGLGLGLALVKYVVTAHGGEVWAESKDGVGSTFGFRIPV